MTSAQANSRFSFRSALRTVAGVIGFCVLMVLGATVLAATGQADRTGSVIALVVAAGAFAVLHWAIVGALGHSGLDDEKRVRRRIRLCRFALGFAALAQFYLWSGLPIPTRLRDLPAHLPLLGALAATIAAAVLLRRSPRAARVLLVALSAWGLLTFVNVVWALTGGAPAMGGPAYAIAIFAVICMAAATWYALWAFRRVRR